MNGDNKQGAFYISEKNEAEMRATDVELAFSRWYGFQPLEQRELYVQLPHCFLVLSHHATAEERRLLTQMLAEE
jgi:hypothetical protein